MSINGPVLIVEQNTSGHRMHYVRLLLEEIDRGDCDAVILTSLGASKSPEWQLHLGGFTGKLKYLESHRLTAAGIRKLVLRMNVSHVVIPDGDRLCMEIGIRRKWPRQIGLSLLIMREFVQDSKFQAISDLRQKIKNALVQSADSVENVNVFLLKSSLWTGVSKRRVVKDPITLLGSDSNRDDILSNYGAESDRFWFGVLGAITPRKNLSVIVEALTGVTSTKIGLIVAGKISEEVQDQLPAVQKQCEEHGISLAIHDSLLEDLEFDSLVRSVDCLVVAHSNEGPSGIMGKAALAGTKVVAAGAMSLKQDCAAVPSLAIWTPLTTRGLTDALSRSVIARDPRPFTELSVRDFASVLL